MPFHAGFDMLQYPEAAMEWLRSNTKLVWCGYYLAPAPNRQTSTWKGALAGIRDKWGLLPIYVGQQDVRTADGSYSPSSTLTVAQGTLDGSAACDLVSEEGFSTGSFVYLDWEYGALNGGGKEYVKAWISTVAKSGLAQPGIYCSYLLAPVIANFIDLPDQAPTTRFFCWRVRQADPHPFTGDITSLPELDPAGCGFPAAQAWQHEQQAVVTFPAGAPVGSLIMDFSTSTLTDPGAP
jgi:hypothetical protein